MQFLRVLNFLIGFSLIFLASCCGFFLAKDSSYALLLKKELLSSWAYLLQKSAHAHTNLFGFLHIAFGQTLASSKCSLKWKIAQTVGLFLGSFAMSFLLLFRSHFPVSPGAFDIMGYTIAFFLSFSLLALASHSFGLLRKLISLS